MKALKKGYWAFVANLLTILGFFANIVQFVRNTLCFAFEIPQTLVNLAAGFMGVSCILACVIMDETLVGKIFAGIGFILIVILVHRLASFAAMLVQALLVAVLAFVDLSSFVNYSANHIYKAIINYTRDFGSNEPTRLDRILLFGIMSILHKLHVAFDKIRKIICILLYPAFAGYAFWWIYHEFYGPQFDNSSLTVIDHAIAIFLIGFVTVLALYLAYCFSSALREGAESVSVLDHLYQTWSEAFRYAEPNSKQHNERTYQNNRTSEQHNEHTASDAHCFNENEYYSVLLKAKDMQELKQIYRKLCKSLHPDVSQLPQEEATQEQAKLNNAYADLKQRYSN